ncbi:aspartic proteinase-like protein 1 [Tanacetum coccineum]
MKVGRGVVVSMAAAVVVLLGECSCLLQAQPWRRFVNDDVEKQTMKLAGHLLFPSGGSNIISGGNDLGWLYYTYIAIGMPSVSFLVALDTGSDLLWLPCDCVQCAPLSGTLLL